jgi:hypothetical protein
MSNLVIQSGETGTNDFEMGDEGAGSNNNVAQNKISAQSSTMRPTQSSSQSQSRTQYDDRRSRRRSDQGSGYRSSRNGDQAPSGNSVGLTGTDLPSFRIIAERNVFDPNRYPHAGPRGPAQRNPVVDSFALVGVMSYEKGTFAFFSGSSSDYQKALKQDDTIAGYRVASIDANAVKLATGTNEVELQIGMRLRREDQGQWKVSTQTDSYTASSSPSNSSGSSPSVSSTTAATNVGQTDSSTSGADNDVLKRLMQRREQE